MAALTDASARLDRALGACREADAELVLASLQTLCLQARAAHPAAYAIEFEWSDQGDFLTVSALIRGDRSPLEWEDTESIAWNLEERGRSVWEPFMVAITTFVRRYSLPITTTLATLAERGTHDD